MDNFKAINESVPFRAVVQKYIGPINQSGFIKCPAHYEKTPSCKVYAHTIHCFGCGYTADAIRVVSDSMGIKPLEAAKILNTEYSLGLDLKNLDKTKVCAILKEKDKKTKAKQLKLNELKNQYNAVCRRLQECRQSKYDIWEQAAANADIVMLEYQAHEIGEEISNVEHNH